MQRAFLHNSEGKGEKTVVRLIRAGESDAPTIHRMQVEAFAELLSKYRDYETNPCAEPEENAGSEESTEPDTTEN